MASIDFLEKKRYLVFLITLDLLWSSFVIHNFTGCFSEHLLIFFKVKIARFRFLYTMYFRYMFLIFTNEVFFYFSSLVMLSNRKSICLCNPKCSNVPLVLHEFLQNSLHLWFYFCMHIILLVMMKIHLSLMFQVVQHYINQVCSEHLQKMFKIDYFVAKSLISILFCLYIHHITK